MDAPQKCLGEKWPLLEETDKSLCVPCPVYLACEHG